MIEDDLEVLDSLASPALKQPEVRAASPLSSAPGLALSAAAAAALAACGGGGGSSSGSSGSSSGSSTPPDPVTLGRADVKLDTSKSTQLTINQTPGVDDAKISRFLQQAKFGATDADIASVKQKGYAKWLEDEIAKPFTMGWDWLNRQGYSDIADQRKEYADYMVWGQLMGANDGLRKRAALALSELLVVSHTNFDFQWSSHAITHYWDTLCKHALGNFRDLLEAITLNAAMGYYLNTKGNSYNAARQPDENFAREVMQLFTIGLVELEIDGTHKKDGAGNDVDTYTAEDIKAMAHMFTGWDWDTSQGGMNNAEFTRLPMKQTGKHSTEGKTIFDVKPAGFPVKSLVIAANTNGRTAMTLVLDYLFNHDNTAPFVSKQLIQRLVTSNPSTTYVRDVATVFKNSKGDLAHVFGAILLHNEARGVVDPSNPFGPTELGKLREPIVRLAQWARTFGVVSKSGQWKVGNLTSSTSRFLGQSPLRSPSVFNFFRPGYAPPSSSLPAKLVAPEFQVVNESSVGGYLNFMMQAIKDGVSGSSDMQAAYIEELKLVASPTLTNPMALVQRLNRLLCGGSLSPATEKIIADATGTMAPVPEAGKPIPTPNQDQARNRVCAAVLMVMACPEYLVQQ
jgi:uncharacterized protein (DUF1800 family)